MTWQDTFEWGSPDGHYWWAQEYGGQPAPVIQHKQIWATCVCLRSGWIAPPPQRSGLSNSEGRDRG